MLSAVQKIHALNLIHRDIKPANFLINSDCSVQLCDFGLSRSVKPKQENKRSMSRAVQSRWYRSPEIILIQEHYDQAADMWSVGCILHELLVCSDLKITKKFILENRYLFKGTSCFPLSPLP